ncbi:MAG: phage tail protein [Bacteroidetes bacterium]|nr:phage tail protein [Bacteroidota bacterium]
MQYYPPVGYFFTVTFVNNGADFGTNLAQNAFDCNFKEVGGLTSEIQMEYFAEGGVNDMQHPLPKGAKFGNITLKRGLLIKSELANWMYDSLENFQIVPREIVIILLGPLAVPIAGWHVTGYPSNGKSRGLMPWTMPSSLKALSLPVRNTAGSFWIP